MAQSWINKVAESSGTPVEEVERLLQRRGIRPERTPRAAPSLMVTRIAFRGEKRGRASGKFSFNWSGLSSGLWVLTSHDNLVGKSSVLEIVLWCLRGHVKRLQEDVLSWLEAVSFAFQIDTQQYLLEFQVQDKVPIGTLSRLRPDGELDEIDGFSSDQGFSATMSRFMMDALDLEPLPFRQGDSDEKTTVAHGWNALSGALYFGGDHKLLLGDVQWGGLPGRMLQMYVGLPWATTVMQAVNAKKEVEQERARSERTNSEAAVARTTAKARVEADVNAARQRLLKTPAEQTSVLELERLSGEVARQSMIVVELRHSVADTEQQHEQLKRLADLDVRLLRDLRENLVASAFFNGLQPSCCPRCDASVSKDRIRRESVQFHCSLCSEKIPEDQMDDASDAIREAEERSSVSKAAVEHSRAFLHERRQALKQAEALQKSAIEQLEASTASDAFRLRREAELELARREGALEELKVEPTAVAAPSDIELVEAAWRCASELFEAHRGDLLSRLNTEILRLAKLFGVRGLQEVRLNHVAQMRLKKGGEATSFSKLTAGERLRLRIATAIALLRVGIERGVGRHPGLLIIDSPAAEETSDQDLAALLAELNQVAADTPELQIFVASANASEVVPVLGPDRCQVAPPGDYLW